MNYLLTKYDKRYKDQQVTQVDLPSSKSESNRLLVMNALSQGKVEVTNLSSARDTQTLISLLKRQQQLTTFDVLDAGTAMRFLTAYLAVSSPKRIALTGTDRMKKRPIGTLVNALRSIGAIINYENEDGYPPLQIEPFQEQMASKIVIPGNISSQYISALLMVAPALPEGLEIEIKPPIFSRPYIDMTLRLMELSGIQYFQKGNVVTIPPQAYISSKQRVESDWSAASYWFSIVALSKLKEKVFLKGLKAESFQGDQVIKEIAQQFGVDFKFENNGLLLVKERYVELGSMVLDFKKSPDLAQTILPCAAALKFNVEMTGLESLRIKETDRIAALQNELSKFNCLFSETARGVWKLDASQFSTTHKIEIETYEDHRMAMGFAPLALKHQLLIKDISVVDKSYPSFWSDLQLFGFNITEQ